MLVFLNQHFISALDGLAFGLLYFTLAAGLALVLGSMDVLNLAHGTLYLGGALLAYKLTDGSPLALMIAVLVGLAAGAVGGTVLAGLTAPLAGRGHLDQALLTLGIALIVGQGFAIATGGAELPVQPPKVLDDSIAIWGHRYPVYRLVFIGIALVLAITVWLTVERSRIGALVRATVADRAMVSAMGVNPRLVLVGVYAAGAALAVTGGVLGAPILPPGPGVDDTVLVMSLVVVVMGGLGSIRGAFFASLAVGEIDTLGRALFPSLAAFLLFGTMFLVLAIRPVGFGGRARAA